MSELTRLLNNRATAFGIFFGVACGLSARLMAYIKEWQQWFSVMTVAFLVLVPIGTGILTVIEGDNRSIGFRILAPWGPMFFTLVATVVFAWEGAIRVYLAIPVVFPFASLGGILGGFVKRRSVPVRSLILAAPFVAWPLESRIESPENIVVSTQQILIDAPREVVWPLIVSVDSIRPDELEPRLFRKLGFPKPISATLDHPGVGGFRRARFEHGLVFTEAITRWDPGNRLAFTIDPNTDSIPSSTLDAHVTIGGSYFDILTGTCTLEPYGRMTLLTLESTHRVSTHFNVYAGWWADRIMASIQCNILLVHKKRAEQLTHDSTV